MKVIGYARVSTDAQADLGVGLVAQESAIRDEAHRRGWDLVSLYCDIRSGRSMNGRNGLSDAVTAIEAGEADALVVAKLDRLSRSLIDFAQLMQRSRRKGWSLVALDLGIDTSSPQGELMANVLATFAQFERRLIGQRTKEALAAKKAHGVRLGRPRSIADDVRERIRRERSAGHTLAQIADRLNRDAVPTAHGGRAWHPNTVRKALLAV